MFRRDCLKVFIGWIAGFCGLRTVKAGLPTPTRSCDRITSTGEDTVCGTLTKPQPRTLYWVGGVGDWDDRPGEKWSLTSGGKGGEPVPEDEDSVLFFQPNSRATFLMLDLEKLQITVGGNLETTHRGVVFCGPIEKRHPPGEYKS